MTDDAKKKKLKMPSRKALLIAGTIILLAAALWLVFGQGLVGERQVDFTQLSKDQLPKSIETEVIPEYRELERALGCLIDGRVYVIVTRGEKPTAGYEASIENIAIEKTDGGNNMKVYAKFTDPSEGTAVSQIVTYPYVVAKTELTSLPDTVELVVKYAE